MNMKFLIYRIAAFCLLSCAPAWAVDPTGPYRSLKAQSSPRLQVDGEAVRVLRQATETYHAATGFQFEYEERLPQESYRLIGRGRYAFKRPNYLRITKEAIAGSQKRNAVVVNNNANIFVSYRGEEYEVGATQPGYDVLQQAIGGWGIGTWIYHLAAARSLVNVTERGMFPQGVFRVRYLQPRAIDGKMVEGVQIRMDGVIKDLGVWTEDTAWFDVNNHLLYRTQYIGRDSYGTSSFSNRLFNVILNPEFAPDTFQFVPPQGAKKLKQF